MHWICDFKFYLREGQALDAYIADPAAACSVPLPIRSPHHAFIFRWESFLYLSTIIFTTSGCLTCKCFISDSLFWKASVSFGVVAMIEVAKVFRKPGALDTSDIFSIHLKISIGSSFSAPSSVIAGAPPWAALPRVSLSRCVCCAGSFWTPLDWINNSHGF